MDYRKRRDALLDKLNDYDLVLLYSGKAPYRVGDETYPFEVDRDFYYLTGLDKPNEYLVIFKLPDGYQETLLIERFDEQLAKWVGPKILKEQAEKISGIEDVLYIDELNDCLIYYLNYFLPMGTTLAIDLKKEEIDLPLTTLDEKVNELRNKFPTLPIKNISKEISELRLIKSKEETDEIVKGINITNEALRYMWSNIKEGMNEAEAQAYFDFVIRKKQAGYSFESIFASGKNTTTLHYSQNNTAMDKDSLLLTDLGATSHYYCADITRTVPVNGKFTTRQKEIYDLVLRANKHIIEYIKPGYTLPQINQELIRFYKKEMPKVNLDPNKLTDYYFHGVSHMLGLQCHDCQLPSYKIRNGNVFTVEPGLYIEEEGIGIRIEDNVWIQNNKAVVLSKDIIKEIDDIEKFFEK